MLKIIQRINGNSILKQFRSSQVAPRLRL
jgi:hypothetical protein